MSIMFSQCLVQFSSLTIVCSRNSVSVLIGSVLKFNIQNPIMSATTKNSAHGNKNLSQDETEVLSSQEDISGSHQKADPEVSFHPSRAQQVIPSIFMPYIEGPKMDRTVNDGLYHRFLKWCLKCENILECELAALPE